MGMKVRRGCRVFKTSWSNKASSSWESEIKRRNGEYVAVELQKENFNRFAFMAKALARCSRWNRAI
jgi:hypothetical protein